MTQNWDCWPESLLGAPHVALGFSLHGCWVSRASISRDNVLEKSSTRRRQKLQYFFWLSSKISGEVLLIQLHSVVSRQSLRPAQKQGEGNYAPNLHGSMARLHCRRVCGIWGTAVAIFEKTIYCINKSPCRIPLAQFHTRSSREFKSYLRVVPVMGKGAELLIPMYSFVITTSCPWENINFQTLSFCESRQGSFLQPGGIPVIMRVTETWVLALGIESNVRIDICKTRKGF